MARHRSVRHAEFYEEYEGYHDVYGHSAEDNFMESPSHREFLFKRDNSPPNEPTAGHSRGEDIEEEEDELDQEFMLSDEDRAKLEPCLAHMESALAPIKMSRQDKVKIIIRNRFDNDKIIRAVLAAQCPRRREKDILLCPFMSRTARENRSAFGPNYQGNKPPPKPNKAPLYGPVDFAARSASSSGRASPSSGIDIPGSRGSSGRGSPIAPAVESEEAKQKKKEQYEKERANSKEHLYMIVIGHVDAGKSTMMGHILYDIGEVNQKTMHKFEVESKKMGKQSFMYAWVLDATGEERTRGITMDVARFQFETNSKLVTLLDAPGHKDFIPKMITGAAQADVALLVVDATRGEFETGFNFGGQTREHTLLVRSLGVNQLAVAVNKLDTVDWAQERFNEIIEKMKPFLKQAGFKESSVRFVPVSGLTGQNLVEKPTEERLLSWYEGPCLLEVIDGFRPPVRPVAKPFRLSINDKFKSAGNPICISGRVETGVINVGDIVRVCPSRELATIKSLSINNVLQDAVFAGDQVEAALNEIEMKNISIGDILCDHRFPVQITSKFEARVVIFNMLVPMTKGCDVVLHHQSLVESAVITKLSAQLDKSTGEAVKKNPRFLQNNSSAIIQVTMPRPIGLELYSDCKELGRITLRQRGVTIAAGLVTKILD